MDIRSSFGSNQLDTSFISDSDSVLPKAVCTPLLHRLFPVPDPGNGRCRDFATAVQGQESLKQVRTRLKQRTNQIQIAWTSLLLIVKENKAFK